MGFALLFIAFQGTSPAAAEDPSAVVGTVVDSGGQLYRLETGPYGVLFPGGASAAPEDLVLALTKVTEGGPEVRMLVPGTEGPEAELDVSVVAAPRQSAFFVSWTSQDGLAAATAGEVVVSAFRNGAFSEAVVVRESLARDAGPVKFAVTRDRGSVGSAGATQEVERTTLHAIWWQDDAQADGSAGVLYVPVVFVDGSFIGEIGAQVLNGLDPGVPLEGSAVTESILKNPTIAAGKDHRSVILAFADEATSRLVTLEVHMLPMELHQLKASAEEFVLDYGGPLDLAGIESLSEEIGAHLVDIGAHFHLGLRTYFAASVSQETLDLAWGLGGPGVPLESLSEEIGAHLVDIGAKAFGSGGMERIYDSSRFSLLTLNALGSGLGVHLVRLYVVASFPAPETGEGHTSVFLSSTGESSLVCWESPSALHYRETEAEGWSEVHTILLDGGLDRTAVEQALIQRIESR